MKAVCTVCGTLYVREEREAEGFGEQCPEGRWN